MARKNLISVATTAPTSVLANGTIPLATVVRRYGCPLNLSGNSISIIDCGSNYYLVNVTATFTAPAAGTVTLTLQQNGVDVVGATASTTVSTASTEVRSLSFSAIVRTFNNSSIDSLTLVNKGVAITVANTAISVIQE